MSAQASPGTECDTGLAAPFVGPWICLAGRSRYEAAELRRQMGLLAGPPEWFESLVFGMPVQQWLNLARIWDAVVAVLEGRSRSESELALSIPNGPTFWTWGAEFVEITGGLPDQTIRIRRAAHERGHGVGAASCGRMFSREELPATARRDLMRVSALCHPCQRSGGGECRQPRGCPLAAQCLHSRLRSGVEQAREVIAALVLRDNRLRTRIAAKWPLADEQNVLEAIERAVLDFLDDPCRFDPGHGTELAHFLAGGALRCLRNRERSECRRRQMVGLLCQNTLLGAADASESEPSPCDLLMVGEGELEAEGKRSWRVQVLGSFARRLSATDLGVLRLILDGKRDHGPYARVLGITGQPDSVQRKIVNRAKQRLHKRLKRLLNSSSLSAK
jgi:hypothetical protein